MKTPETTATNEQILTRIKDYIATNNLSLPKIAKEAGLDYFKLWALLNRSQTIKLTDYVALCRAFREPLETFIPE